MASTYAPIGMSSLTCSLVSTMTGTGVLPFRSPAADGSAIRTAVVFLGPDATGSYGRREGIRSALRSWTPAIGAACRTPRSKESGDRYALTQRAVREAPRAPQTPVAGSICTDSPQPQAAVWFGLLNTNCAESFSIL